MLRRSTWNSCILRPAMTSPDTKLAQRIDLWLLTCLEALVDERSVTRAAERLGTTQPAMSNSLARLRQVLGDPVLVKTPEGMAATPRALELARDTSAQRRHIESALARSLPFDLSTTHRRVVISLTDHPAHFVMPALYERAARDAPHFEIVTRLPDHTRIRQWLENGECDLAVGYFPDLPTDLRSTLLFEDTVSVISTRVDGAPPVEMTLDDYLKRRHLIVGGPFAPLTTLETVIDRTLAGMGERRVVGGLIPSISLPFFVVANSSLVVSMPTHLSRYFASMLPLALHPLPIPGIDVQILMTWHERTQLDPAQQWVRRTIREIFSELDLTRH